VKYLPPGHPQLNDHPLLPLVVDQEVTMEKKAAVFFQMRARYRLSPRMLGIEGRGPKNNVLAVERAIALAN
jgi:hypothetical protein